MYNFLDKFLVVLHTVVVLFNLFGWVWQKTRIANLILLLLTGLSWFMLGIWYGIGYCPLTDWHWKVLRKLGEYNLPDSYIEYKIERITGLDLPGKIIDSSVIIFFFTALIISVYLNIRDWRKK